MDQHRTNRDEMANVLVQTEIDRSALEQLRSSELALAEQASNRLVNAIADAAEVLTPEQRIQLAELRQQFHR
jgi:Spy/CpxP family protein refolding chaperone